jgi:hypothetical protein
MEVEAIAPLRVFETSNTSHGGKLSPGFVCMLMHVTNMSDDDVGVGAEDGAINIDHEQIIATSRKGHVIPVGKDL